MLRCCLRKPQTDNCEQTLVKRADYGTIIWAGSYQTNWSNCNDKGIHQITLKAVQPRAEQHISARRRSWAESSRSHSSSQSEHAISSKQSEPFGLTCQSEPCSPTTYPAEVTHFNRESFLESYFKQDEVFGAEHVHPGGTVEGQGKPATVLFSVQRIPTANGCWIKLDLKAARNLPCKGRGHVYDPIAVLTLLPGNQQTKVSTRVLGTLNPNFLQTFIFSLNSRNQRFSSLCITVYDAARRKRHMSIGHAILPCVETWAKTESPVHYHLVLGKSSVIHGPIGDIYITLSYVRKEKCLTVGLLRVRHLAVAEMVGCANKELHAKVSILFAGEAVKTMKSGIICPSSRSFINEKFQFFAPETVFDEITLVVTLVLCSVFSHDVPIGRVTIGPYFQSGGSALKYWDVLVQSEQVIKDWYTLYL